MSDEGAERRAVLKALGVTLYDVAVVDGDDITADGGVILEQSFDDPLYWRSATLSDAEGALKNKAECG